MRTAMPMQAHPNSWLQLALLITCAAPCQLKSLPCFTCFTTAEYDKTSMPGPLVHTQGQETAPGPGGHLQGQQHVRFPLSPRLLTPMERLVFAPPT